MEQTATTDISQETLPFLQGGGEMGALIRAFDWNATPLGPPHDWPLSLRIIVGTLLASRFPMFLWWGDELIQFYNDAYRPSLGKVGKHPTALGQRGADCWTEIWPTIYPLIQHVKGGGEATWNEDQLIPIYRNGGVEDVYWTFSYSAVRNDDGGIGGVLVVCTETTENVNNLRQLEESRSELQFAIDATELGTWDFNPLTGRFTANARLKEWFGLPPQKEIALTDAVDVMAEKDRKRVTDAIQHALQWESGGRYDIEYTIIHPQSGIERIVCAKGRAWFGDDKIAYRFNGTLQDVTTQSIAGRKIQESEEQFRIFSDNLQNLAWIADADGWIFWYNQRWYDYTGTTLDDMRGWGWERVHHPDHIERVRNFVKSGWLADEPFELTFPLRGNDGTFRWFLTRAVPVFNSEGRRFRWIGTNTDIHEQVGAQEALKESEARYRALAATLEQLVLERTAELMRSNEELLQFAHVASHDLKEPVRKILTFANMLEQADGQTLSERGSFSLQKIFNAADRMMNMVNGVLAYSKVAATEQEAVTINLAEIIASVESDLEVLIQQTGAGITIGSLPRIKGAPVLIHQLFYNLVNNALKFGKAGVPPRIIITGEAAQHGMVKIIVADNGIGFEPEYAATIFKTFARLNTKDQYEGTGLGLSLCRKIAERHGGTITAESAVGAGAKFTIMLPQA